MPARPEHAGGERDLPPESPDLMPMRLDRAICFNPLSGGIERRGLGHNVARPRIGSRARIICANLWISVFESSFSGEGK